MRNLQSGLQEYRVEAVEGNSSPVDPNWKGRQNATRVCNYCCTIGQTSSWCCKKLRVEDLKTKKMLWKESHSLKTQDYKKNQEPSHGSKEWKRGQGFQRRNQNYTNDGPMTKSPTAYQNSSPRPNPTYGSNNPNNAILYGQRSNQSFNHSIETIELVFEMDLQTIKMETGETLEFFLVLHLLKGEISHRTTHIDNKELINQTILLFADLTVNRLVVSPLTNRNYCKPTTWCHPMWSATTDDSNNELSDIVHWTIKYFEYELR